MDQEKEQLRLAIAGGGTGGHVLPALAVVEELRQRQQIGDLIWIGSHDGVERQAAERAGIRYVAIPTGKLRRYLSLRNVLDLVKVPMGIVAARRALRAFKPSVILSTGGFVSVPTVIAARGIAPVVTHEQTAILGLATRINARFAAVLAISFAQTEKAARNIHGQVAVTGNPVRTGLSSGERDRGLTRFGFSQDLPLLYVTGGARGATPINQRIASLLPKLLEQTQVLHQTGPADANSDAEELMAKRSRFREEYQRRYAIVEFIGDELPDVYAAADLVIGRSGAGTVAELAYVGMPAILIPLPGTGGDEQAVNARVLADAGGAKVIPQAEATPERLHVEITALLSDASGRERMATAARAVSRPDAAERLADLLVSIARSRSMTQTKSDRRLAPPAGARSSDRLINLCERR
jgi:UDP-N-acetylglucosamine--N-acetylmuramyl-(pentapeptide) pyrophosphoryl-undecaprenol N-acetylglucosamine transferase